jgi:radical SAM protein with 4Fe4S-binding SPASM domain
VILQNALALKKEGFHIGAIALMTAENIFRIGDMYQWFKQHDIPFNLNRIFPATTEASRNCADAVSGEQYAHAICKLFDIWIKDTQPLNIRIITEFVSSFLRGPVSSAEKCADSFLGVAPSGVLLPCGRFDSDSYSIGNYYTDSVSAVLKKKCEINTLGQNRLNREKKCTSCDYNDLCRAGCLHSRLSGWLEEECIANKIIWNHIEKTLTPMGLTRGMLRKDSTKAILEKLLL